MVENFGWYGTFMKHSRIMKPTRFGHKIWYTKIVIGYLLNFTIYEGTTGRKTDNINNFALGFTFLLEIIDGLPVNLDGNLKPMRLSVDNFFNSFQLIDQCSLGNIPLIGTLRADHLREVLISIKKEVLKKYRGYFKVAHACDQGKEKAVVAWNDNAAIIMASNRFNSEPIQKT